MLTKLTKESEQKVIKARKMVDDIVKENKVVYGITTGFGKFARTVIEKEKLQQNSLEIGADLTAGFHKLAEKHSIIGEVRGKGLMLGVELVKDRATKEPASAECAAAFEKCKDLGLLIGKGGLFGNTLRIKPPMCIHQADADFMLEVIDEALAGV